jgi:hypothetical protein
MSALLYDQQTDSELMVAAQLDGLDLAHLYEWSQGLTEAVRYLDWLELTELARAVKVLR